MELIQKGLIVFYHTSRYYVAKDGWMDPKVGGFALLNNLRMDAAMPVSLMATLACCNLFAFDQKMVFNPNSHEGHTSWAISYQNLKKEAYQKCKLRRFVRKSQLR